MARPRRLVLASSSPRRLALLHQIGIEPDEIVVPSVEEAALARELPLAYARRIAAAKAEAVALPDDLVLAADTVVACGRRILPKAETADDAQRCLRLLSGRRHRVYTGVCARFGETVRHRDVTSVVRFKRLEEAEIAGYLRSREWHGKAGGYAIQGRAEAFVTFISGSYSNVVGLPLYETTALLRGLGWRP